MDLFNGLLEEKRCITRGCRVQLVQSLSRRLGICIECRERHERIRELTCRVYGKRGLVSESVAELRGKGVGTL